MEKNNKISASYLALYADGELTKRAAAARELLVECRFCPRRCQVDRLAASPATLGICRTGARALVSSYAPHFGEEGPLVGTGGSGTIFFTHCNLLCVFCQNYEISHQGDGVEVTSRQLAAMMLSLQEQGCHNINLVTPSHVVPQILAALLEAAGQGLTLPLVYNSSGYDAVDTLEMLDGVVDIYMPDFKFWEPDSATRYAKAPDYPDRARQALKEMHRQVGDLVVDASGIAVKGLLVRHLVMPGGLDESAAIFRFLARDISPGTYVNVMDQYRPCGRAHDFPPIHQPLGRADFEQALILAREAGLTRLDKKDLSRLFQLLVLRPQEQP